jgi:radical SAM protein with 4Fe4S-binding SPASM domain
MKNQIRSENTSKEVLLKNIKRKIPILNREPQLFQGIPIPSWIELSLIDVCNRTCSFCPKSDSQIAPDTFQKMELVLIDKLISDLRKIDFQGSFCLCGYGEPLLHKELIKIINKLGSLGGVEVITNGDAINEKTLINLYESSASQVLISMYDGPEQRIKFQNLRKKLNIPEKFVILRDRWHGADDNFGLGDVSNRGGTLGSPMDEISKKKFNKKKCYYTAYQTIVDWDGSMYVCPNDWNRKMSMGNIMQKDFFDVWNGSIISSYRKELLNGERKKSPCNVCNVDGTVYGEKHSNAWLEAFKK